ncbi:MAG: Hsp20/alpha crystallin family protein [Halobacteriaceae archaeon]
MPRDDRDDPFDDFFREIERMMNEAFDGQPTSPDTGFGNETHVDVQETEDSVRVVADLPGVSKDDLTLKCDGETLTISASTPRREYDERIRLPARVDEHSADASFNNGVLEVSFTRVDDSADIDLT